jgi:hypothetical protein
MLSKDFQDLVSPGDEYLMVFCVSLSPINLFRGRKRNSNSELIYLANFSSELLSELPLA